MISGQQSPHNNAPCGGNNQQPAFGMDIQVPQVGLVVGLNLAILWQEWHPARNHTVNRNHNGYGQL